ncbi:MAG: hypothetical protein QOJ32_2274 [Frankiaceae bacterium]|nr:hypothetical protein [Frankiaceae bacterium]MDQ1650464.1 hypothetical protein [Frankiaceae bacterium]
MSTPNSTVSPRADESIASGTAQNVPLSTGGLTVSAPNGQAGHGGVTIAPPAAAPYAAGDSEDIVVQTWLPVAEAAERTSVSESALRKWIKAGELATRDAPGPRGLRTEVTVEAVVARARQAGIDASPRAGLDLADAFARLENLTGQLVAMSDRAARAEVERDHVKRRVDDLKTEKASAIADERSRTSGERARADELAAQLAAAREALTAERARADAMLVSVPRRKRHLFDRPASGVPGGATPAAGSEQ